MDRDVDGGRASPVDHNDNWCGTMADGGAGTTGWSGICPKQRENLRRPSSLPPVPLYSNQSSRLIGRSSVTTMCRSSVCRVVTITREIILTGRADRTESRSTDRRGAQKVVDRSSYASFE